MATAAIHYLEAAKTEQIAADLMAQGYAVEQRANHGGYVYDVLATKNGRTIAIEVKARDTLGNALNEIKRLREEARHRGYDEFRLVVANPPREKTIEVDGLEHSLMDYLGENVPHELLDIYSYAVVNEVSNVEINTTHIMRDTIHIVGSAFVGVEFHWGGGESQDGIVSSTGFPFDFDIVLGNDLTIEQVHTLNVDTSSYYE